MTSLPTELWLHILDQIVSPLSWASQQPDRFLSASVTLRNASLVCKGWSIYSQSLLFRSIRFNCLESLEIFYQTLILDCCPKYQQLTASVLSLVLPSCKPDEAYHRSFTALLPRLTGLHHLEIPAWLGTWPAEITRELMNQVPCLLSLVLRTGVPRKYARILTNVLSAFPSVQILEVENLVGPHLPPVVLPQKLKLASLTLRSNYVQPYYDFMDSILSPPTSPKNIGLSHLSLGDFLDLPRICQLVGDSICSLSLDRRNGFDAASSLQLCTQLQHISFTDTSLPFVWIWKFLPRTLISIHIRCGEILRVPLLYIKDFVGGISDLPCLKEIAWKISTKLRDHHLLVQFCLDRNIRLLVTSHEVEESHEIKHRLLWTHAKV